MNVLLLQLSSTNLKKPDDKGEPAANNIVAGSNSIEMNISDVDSLESQNHK